MNILTPKWVHEKVLSGHAPEAIPIPKNSNFDWLYEHRDRINKLMLVPLKTDEMRAQYNSLDKEILAKEILETFDKESFGYKAFIAENKFPYALDNDVDQLLLWVDDNISDEVIEQCIEQYTTSNKFIIFERPRNADKKLVRGTFPQIRHIHIWTKTKTNKDENE